MTLYRHLTLLCLSALFPGAVLAQAGNAENWFQIEVTVFTWDSSNLEQELWQPGKLSLGFPERLRRLRQVSESLQLSDWSIFEPVLVNALTPEELQEPAPVVVGPPPFAPGTDVFQLPDLERTAFLQLPPENHDFIGTNRALTQSAEHRIVFHGVWRQALTRRNAATAVAVMGGRDFNGRREVEGSITFYLTSSGDRAIVESNLWLNHFSTQAPAEQVWELPVLPDILVSASSEEEDTALRYYVDRIIQFQQSRDLRSREFHYLDHPAMGMLVQITPYTLPPLPLPPLPQAGSAAPATPL
ncbi:MAG: hypothetical protein KDI28_00925 [Pseudomonadales bacterium]|nr:hypothetical protein [Pseudomonadales bacterium]MCP5357454.1 hypothetical protein [Pseudomonadales bacterium]